mgnify:CR=1 FL=1
MTPKQLRFIDAYIRLGNATQAAKEAGYNQKYIGPNATKILNSTNVFAEYRRRLEEMQKAQIASEDEILQFHTGIMRGEVKEEIINPVTGRHEELPAGLNIRQRSADALLKHMQHVPGSLLTDEQKLKNAKLKAEIEQIQTDIEAAHDDVQIIDDIGDDDNEES